jgi:hypothetical protein
VTKEQGELTWEELAEQEADELPDREELSLVNGNVAAPINAVVVANVLSDNAVSAASSVQNAPLTQGM